MGLHLLRLFAYDLHFERLFVIFVLARGACLCFPFLDPRSPKGGFASVVRPKWLCKRASLSLSFGPSHLPTVPLSLIRLARPGVKSHFSRLSERSVAPCYTFGCARCVMLFHFLNRFHAILVPILDCAWKSRNRRIMCLDRLRVFNLIFCPIQKHFVSLPHYYKKKTDDRS